MVQRLRDQRRGRAAGWLSDFEAEGTLSVPAVLLHTIGDPIIPVSQAVGYRQEVHAAGTAPSFDAFPLPRYGHCSFEPVELMTAFAILVYRTTGAALLAEAPAFERGMGPALFERTAQAQAELGWGERF